MPANEWTSVLSEERWLRYYEITQGRPPHPGVLKALNLLEKRLDKPGLAVDLGCGAGEPKTGRWYGYPSDG